MLFYYWLRIFFILLTGVAIFSKFRLWQEPEIFAVVFDAIQIILELELLICDYCSMHIGKDDIGIVDIVERNTIVVSIILLVLSIYRLILHIKRLHKKIEKDDKAVYNYIKKNE